LVTDGLIDDNLPEEVDSDMTNVSGTAPATAGPGVEAFSSLYEEEYGRQPGVFNAHAFDAMAILGLAATFGGGNDGQTIRDNVRNVANPDGTEVTPSNLVEGFEMALAGENINYQGASSVTNFDENGDISAATYEYQEVEDRDFVVVDSLEL
jgi:ABC-type branched-subunit amino acid transport system substrate-binding protein